MHEFVKSGCTVDTPLPVWPRRAIAHRWNRLARRVAVLFQAVGLGLACLAVGVAAVPGAADAPAAATGYPDLSMFAQDLWPPSMVRAAPAAGKRVRATLPAYQDTDVYYSLYLPEDWHPGGRYPVIVEFPGNGNYRNKYGDVCTGRVEDCSLGYGLTAGKGCIWICLPFVDPKSRANALVWWGDIAATVSFCKTAVKTIGEDFGGDSAAVILCGFSRGAIACNYIGLHDDEIARLWRAFFVASHYDGAREWPYPGSDRASALVRLRRLGNRPVFVSHEMSGIDSGTYTIIDTVNFLAGTGLPLANFTFQIVPLRNHTDQWVLRDLPARRNVRRWLQEIIPAAAAGGG